MVQQAEAREATDGQSGGDMHVEEEGFLLCLGHRVRELRERLGMTRKSVARDSNVSERHLAHLEVGESNVSITLLRRIAVTLNVSLVELLSSDAEDSVERRLIRRFLERMPQHRLEEVVFRLMRDFGHEETVRRNRVALIGLRGAGKSTLGKRLAKEMGVPFVELVLEVEKDTGMPVSEIFSLYGQTGYRRLEKRTLERVLKQHERAVFSIGGGIVSQADTYDYLLSNCFTVWLKARPEDHMSRVIAQGDLRPMAGNDEAMDDLRHILEAREALYAKADKSIGTSDISEDEAFNRLRQLVHV
ncbi:MAG: helix-turn-helix transcriptional regulator [Proteobacteria bacterium]|nr:helix-turn-helix transcriptional regulator [Pseudomonadota bacterium]